MALSAGLFLRQSQSLVMTPQLMQSIQLLQMTHLELNRFIAQEIERNPLLDMGEPGESGEALPAEERAETEAERDVAGHVDDTASGLGEALRGQLDGDFDNVFQDDGAERRADAPELLGQWKSMPGGMGEAADGYDLEDFATSARTLRDAVDEQVTFALPRPADRLIARDLTDLLDDAGYIEADLLDVAARLGACPADVERVLATLQTFEPPGIFARSLSECLALQLKARNRLDPAMAALLDNLDLLARRDFAALKKICGVDEEDLVDMLAEIRTLDPKPGTRFDTGMTETVVPDVVVRPAADGSWHVELNADTLPRVLVNQDYYARVSRVVRTTQEDQAFLADCLQKANWLTRSLDQRARTIMKVAGEIVRQQDAFLVHGVDHLRPLNLKTVADAIKMHESTVSRVTSNKYMLTPRGLFELKYFFTVSLGSVEGGDAHSAESVRHRIRALIAQEAADAVLSDDDIVDILKEGGVDIARRTVAKYREAMNIASSVQRRREKRALSRISG